MHVWVQTSADLCDTVASPNTSIEICKAVEWCEAAERRCSPVGFDFRVANTLCAEKGIIAAENKGGCRHVFPEREN